MNPLLLAVLQSVTLSASAPQVPASDTILPPADSMALATAYQDDGARELVRLARAHRDHIDASVFRYTATSRQRVSVGLRALRRDRILYRRETASRLEWRRDGPSRVEVLGAREAIPMALPGVRVPDGFEQWARSFLPAPGDDRLFVNPTGGGFAWHPLVDGAEALYRYSLGATTTIRLPDGRMIQLAELRVQPRTRTIRVVDGSFWIELENHGIVQAVFRPARGFDLERDLAELDPEDADDASEVPAILRPIRFDVQYVAVDYGLWEMRWWMPRLMAFEGSLQMGAMRVPISVELLYEDYRVEADRHGLPELPPLVIHLAGDTARPRTQRFPVRVVVPDSAALLTSPYLPRSIFASGERLMSESEVRELADRLGALPPPPWSMPRPSLTYPWHFGRGLLRYNRVEGLSAGVRADVDVGRAAVDISARMGTGDQRPNLELGVVPAATRRSWRVAGYHRLTTADPATRPFGVRNSLSALVLGQDDGIYFRASGADVTIESGPGSWPYQVRVYAERQAPAGETTRFSLRRLLDDQRDFGAEVLADPADQVGVSARVGVDRGFDPAGGRWSAAVDVTAEAGSYLFLRPGLTLTAGVPVARGVLVSGELGAGTMVGRDGRGAPGPTQANWFLGGAQTLRGFAGGALQGPEYGRARVELSNRLPAARLVVFTDAGWAGRFEEYRSADVAVAVGIGASFLDGLFRVDLARAVTHDRGWRLEFSSDLLF
jgi:hypothetical protein